MACRLTPSARYPRREASKAEYRAIADRLPPRGRAAPEVPRRDRSTSSLARVKSAVEAAERGSREAGRVCVTRWWQRGQRRRRGRLSCSSDTRATRNVERSRSSRARRLLDATLGDADDVIHRRVRAVKSVPRERVERLGVRQADRAREIGRSSSPFTRRPSSLCP